MLLVLYLELAATSKPAAMQISSNTSYERKRDGLYSDWFLDTNSYTKFYLQTCNYIFIFWKAPNTICGPTKASIFFIRLTKNRNLQQFRGVFKYILMQYTHKFS